LLNPPTEGGPSPCSAEPSRRATYIWRGGGRGKDHFLCEVPRSWVSRLAPASAPRFGQRPSAWPTSPHSPLQLDGSDSSSDPSTSTSASVSPLPAVGFVRSLMGGGDCFFLSNQRIQYQSNFPSLIATSPPCYKYMYPIEVHTRPDQANTK